MRALVIFAVAFALLPNLVVLAASLTSGTNFGFPPQGLSIRWYAALFSDGDFIDAMATSFSLAAITSVVAAIVALLGAFGVVRYRVRGSSLIEGFVLSPLAIPHVIIGIGVLQLYNQLRLQTDLITLSLGHLVITIPFALRMLIASLRGLDRRIEYAAQSLGARPTAIVLGVVLPQMKFGILGALVSVFILSFDDLALTIFLVQPGYSTIPILLFNRAENGANPSILAASAFLLVLTWLAVFLLDRIMSFEKLVLPRAQNT